MLYDDIGNTTYSFPEQNDDLTNRSAQVMVPNGLLRDISKYVVTLSAILYM